MSQLVAGKVLTDVSNSVQRDIPINTIAKRDFGGGGGGGNGNDDCDILCFIRGGRGGGSGRGRFGFKGN
jgi:hypothetical protein